MFCAQCGKPVAKENGACPSCGANLGYPEWFAAVQGLGGKEYDKNGAAEIIRDKARDEAILSSIGEGLIVTDRDGKIVFVNRVTEEMLGWKFKELAGRDIGETIKRVDEKGHELELEERIFSQAPTGEKAVSEPNTYFIAKNKQRVPVSVVTSPIVLGKNIIGAVEVFRDMSKEKAVESAKADFISIASHQLRTPLSALNWLVESLTLSLKDKSLDPVSQAYLDDLAVAGRHAIQIVENLLNASLIESKSIVIEKQKVNLVDLIRAVLKNIEPYAALKKHKVVFEVAGDREAFNAETDPKMLENIVQNLVSNGIDHSPESTEVVLGLKKNGDFFRIYTSNKGPHIPKSEQEHLFEKFYRGESVQRIKAAGFGLGLFIAKAFAEALGGEMGFESKRGKDVLFWFVLPEGNPQK